jgi:hypothetical protein
VSEKRLSYHSPDFYPIEADNLMHAAFLFAVWKARRQFGPGAVCTRLVMETEPGPDGALFEASLTKGVISEPYRFRVSCFLFEGGGMHRPDDGGPVQPDGTRTDLSTLVEIG